jgi:outer membrane protein TolC
MNIEQWMPRRSSIGMALAATVLSGCATFSADGGLDAVSSMTGERTGQAVQFSKSGANPDAAVASMDRFLASPLTPDSAVQLALLNNPNLQASFAELGVAEADLVQAGRLRNPGFSFTRLRGGNELEIDRSVMFDLVGLLTIPLRTASSKGVLNRASCAP